MTTAQILTTLRKAGKPVSLMQLYRYLTNLKIKPAGIRQRPQQYPDDAAARIVAHLGLDGAGQEFGLPSNNELRRARKQATKGTK